MKMSRVLVVVVVYLCDVLCDVWLCVRLSLAVTAPGRISWRRC